MDFDIRPFESKCFISDKEWQMIIQSGSFQKIGKCYYAVYKNHVLTFSIQKNGIINLLQKRKKPAENYELPALTVGMSFDKRVAVYKEERRLIRGQELDVEHFLKYAG